MTFTNCLSSVTFFMYCSVVVLVIVNGQPTTDDDIHEDDITKLIHTVTELRAEQVESISRIGQLEHLLAASVDKIAKLERQLAATSTAKPDASKLSGLRLHSPEGVTLLRTFRFTNYLHIRCQR